jgi:hypothetical protein
MRNIITRLSLFVVLVFFTGIGGCIPEDSVEWSDDGSVGLMRVQGALYLVDGQNGKLTEVDSNEIGCWPDISKDGKWIAYSQTIECNSLPEGLKLLPAGQVKMIEYYAAEMKQRILDTRGITPSLSNLPEECPLVKDSAGWVVRYLCEKADKELADKLGKDNISQGKAGKIGLSQVIVVSSSDLTKRKVVAATVLPVMRVRFAPNNKYLAYLAETGMENMQYSLYAASLDGGVSSLRIDYPVAIGYDWRDDSRAIAYFTMDEKNLHAEEPLVGSVKEKVIVDGNDKLLARPVEAGEKGAFETYQSTGNDKVAAGVIFYPWSSVKYGLNGRLLFCAQSLSLPTSRMDEARMSIFCYDPVTNTVADIIPQGVSPYLDGGASMDAFALSPDKKKLLLPMAKNRFAIYTLGDSDAKMPIEQSEGFGDKDEFKLAPAWKGNEAISCLVSGNNHLLANTDKKDAGERQVIIINQKGEYKGVLSENWPRKIMEKF